MSQTRPDNLGRNHVVSINVEELIEQAARRTADLVLEALDTRPTESRWLTTAEACAYCKLTRNQMYKLTAAGAIPFRRKVGGQGLRFNKEDLDPWLESHYPRVDRCR